MSFEFVRSDDVRHKIEGGIAWVTIDRAPKRNPLSLGVLDSLRCLFEGLASADEVRIAVLTGAGDNAFASGGDLDELARYRSYEDAAAFSRHGKAALDAIRRFPVPVVARINGYALGGGCELALACDQRFAVHHARIGMIHGRLGISPSWGGGNDLVELIGPARALRHLVEARALGAHEAAQQGIVDDVCPDGADFDDWFGEKIEEWRRHPRQVVRAYKALSQGARSLRRDDLDAIETARFAEAWSHDDHWAAVAALHEK